MKCPKCNAWTLVKDTRGTRRRRECANGHRFSTTEVVVKAPAPLKELQRVSK